MALAILAAMSMAGFAYHQRPSQNKIRKPSFGAEEQAQHPTLLLSKPPLAPAAPPKTPSPQHVAMDFNPYNKAITLE